MSTTPPTSTAAEADAPAAVEQLIRQAQQAGASDVHLQSVPGGAEVRFRLDGLLVPGPLIPTPLASRVFGRIKFLARLKTYQESLPQDGRIDKADVGGAHDIRVATYPTVTGEKIVLRLFTAAGAETLDDLGWVETARAELEKVLRLGSGLLLLTGPAGSGKTTTIYACLRRLAKGTGRHIITIEDPAEQIIPGIMQTEIAEERGLTFATAARHLLRQDPQVLVIGEVRDPETAGIVVRAAQTGHLVIATLHAGSCAAVWDRLTSLTPDVPGVAAALEMIVNQRLLRRACTGCGGGGCAACLGTGYRGRVPVVEWVRLDPERRRRLRDGDSASALAPAELLPAAGRRLVEAGITTAAEWERVLGS